MKTKPCTKCKRVLPLTEFSKHKITKDGLNHWCRDCNRERGKKFRASPSGIYTSIQGVHKYWKDKPVIISRADFIEWHNSQEKKCAYCDIPEKYLRVLGDTYNEITYRLSIDCMENDLGYVKGNMVLACLRCNNTKGDYFSFEEMREIGQKYVKPIWMKKVQELKLNC